MMMQLQSICCIFLAIFLLLSHNEVQGRTKLSHLEDIELEKQLKFLNKPAVKTIKTDYGDIYDCVDFYKQPAFDHPLLQNHTFHPKMKPTLSLTKEDHDNSINNRRSNVRFNKESCPDGTVPIRRTTKDDLIRQKHMPLAEDVSFSFASENNFSNKVVFPDKGYKLAMIRTEDNPSNKFAGAGVRFALYNPHVEGKQSSASRIKVQKGLETIQVGWRVDPTLYGDNKTRLYTHFDTGKRNCFNTQCPGFIIVNTDVPLDYVFPQMTNRGDAYAVEMAMYLSRDIINGNWWLLLTDDLTEIGFWPKHIFTELNDFATRVEWGGSTYSPPGVLEPPMGSSFFPAGELRDDAYGSHMKLIDENGDIIDTGDAFTVHMSNRDLYRALYIPNFNSRFRSIAIFGGPGESQD